MAQDSLTTATTVATITSPTSSTLTELLPLLLELNDLKRIRVAEHSGQSILLSDSLTTRMFLRAWSRLVAGEDLSLVAQQETVHMIVSARLAGIDPRVMADGKLSINDRQQILENSFDAIALALDAVQQGQLRCLLNPNFNHAEVVGEVPTSIKLLAAQPRAGATRPGRRRVVLEPAEMHSDHCAMVAVYAVLLAPLYNADSSLPFLTGLAHHLHNARLPDAGHAGDELLGNHLITLMTVFREQAINELPSELHTFVREALDLVYRADNQQAQAFQAADVLDRVLEMRWHAEAAAFTLDVALGEMDIVHPGPVQSFQLEVLQRAGLM